MESDHASSAAAAEGQRPGAPGDWITIWNGRDLQGWKMSGPGRFVVENGTLKAEGGMGLLWYAGRPFTDFVFDLEWKVTRPEDNSGVFIRFPDPGKDPWVAVNNGYEIQICDSEKPQHNTGSIYSFQAPTEVPTNPPGQWNRMEITVRGQDYQVAVNGKTVNHYQGERSRSGYVGIQNHDDGSPVRFRNLRVKILD